MITSSSSSSTTTTTTVQTALLDEYHALLTEAAADHGDSKTSSSTPVFDIRTLSIKTDITERDTLVVVDMQHDFLPGGAFGVDEGDSVIDGICDLIAKFHNAGATVIATKDFHPTDHCSFNTHGGPFPPHCIMGSRGSLIHPRIAETLTPLLAPTTSNDDDDDDDKEDGVLRAHVVHKGFYKGVESFGGFPYSTKTDDWKTRLSYLKEEDVHWTGAYKLRASNSANDANAPPDVMSILDKIPMADLLPKGGRVFCCGLALDYCVIDTAANYCQTTVAASEAAAAGNNDSNCFIIQDLTRAARVPGLGTFGSGFLTDPRVMLGKLVENQIGLVKFDE
jgi:nicotinamidase-related amidase